MSDHGEVKAREWLHGRGRFEQSPRVCVYGCPGLCLSKCEAAGECIVFERSPVTDKMPSVRKIAEVAAVAAVAVAITHALGLDPESILEHEAQRLAGELATIHNLCESDEARLDLARLMVARGIFAARKDDL